MLEIATQVMKFGAATADLVRRVRPTRDFSPPQGAGRHHRLRLDPLTLELVPLTFAVDLQRQHIEITMRAINYARRVLDLQAAVIDQLSVSDLPPLRHIPANYLRPINPRRSVEIAFERALADVEVRAFDRARQQSCPLSGSVRFSAHARLRRKPLRYDSNAAVRVIGWVHGSLS